MQTSTKLLALIAVSFMLVAPSWAYDVHVIGAGISSEQLADVKPKLVKNVVDKMAAHGVVSGEIKNITIDAEISGATFERAEVWVKTSNGGSYLLDTDGDGVVTSFDKRK